MYSTADTLKFALRLVAIPLALLRWYRRCARPHDLICSRFPEENEKKNGGDLATEQNEERLILGESYSRLC